MIGTYYSRGDKNYGYGYLWWIKRIDNENDVPFALGHGCQRIAFIPNANSVIVTEADPSDFSFRGMSAKISWTNWSMFEVSGMSFPPAEKFDEDLGFGGNKVSCILYLKAFLNGIRKYTVSFGRENFQR